MFYKTTENLNLKLYEYYKQNTWKAYLNYNANKLSNLRFI